MLGRNIFLYRLKKGLSKKELATATGIPLKDITRYEQNQRIPDLATTRKIANALGTNLAALMASVSDTHHFQHGEYRKNSNLTKKNQTLICASVEDYFNRFLSVSDILGQEVLRDAPLCHSIIPTMDPEKDAGKLREILGFSQEGPIPNLIDALENKGILIFQLNIENDRFSGMNGFVDSRPYIVINSNMTAERQRSTLVHEIAHLFFTIPEKDDSVWEKHMTAVSGAFLFPEDDAINELGTKRTDVTSDMAMVAKEYGISLQMVAKRAQMLGILSDSAYKRFNIMLSQGGGRKNEPSRIEAEKTSLFKQLVLRAIGEEEISFSKGAELLQIPLTEMRQMASLQEVY